MARKCCICGKDEHHVDLLFKGKDDTYICDACIDRCTEALEKNTRRWQSKPVKDYHKKW